MFSSLIKTPEGRHWGHSGVFKRHSGVFIVNFEHIHILF